MSAELDFDIMILILIIICSFFPWFIGYKSRRMLQDKIIVTIFSIGFFIYSGLGIAYKQTDIEYLLFYFIFCCFFIFCYSLFSGNKSKYSNAQNNLSNSKTGLIDFLYNNYRKLIFVLGVVYILSHFAYLIIPEFRIMEIFDFTGQYKAINHLILRDVRSTGTYTIISYVSLLSRPFFFLWLYKFRRKPIVFVSLVLIPVYLQYVFNAYLSRNDMVLWCIFILAFLYIEKYIKKVQLYIIILIMVVLGLPILNMLSYIRMGIDIDLSVFNFGNTVKRILIEETWYPVLYDQAVASQVSVSVLKYFGWIISLPIPSALLFELLGYIDFPILSYIFSEQVTGYVVTDSNYYILLPSVLGESFMLFGKSLSWMYAIFYSIVLACMIRIFKNNLYTKFWFLYYSLDFFRMMRGGSQSFIAQTINTLPLLLIVLVIIKVQREKKQRIGNQYNYLDKE